MDNPPESDNNHALIGIGKHLKVIAEQQVIMAEQQTRRTEHLRNISAVLTLLLIAIVLFLLIYAVKSSVI